MDSERVAGAAFTRNPWPAKSAVSFVADVIWTGAVRGGTGVSISAEGGVQLWSSYSAESAGPAIVCAFHVPK